MTTNTAQVLPPARVDPRQVSNTLKKTVNWNDANVASGVAFDNSLPANGFIIAVIVEIVTAFDGVAPQLTVGTVGAAYNNIVAAADVNEGATGATVVPRALGRSLTNGADVTPYVKLALSGATMGQAIILIEYDHGLQ